MFTHCLLLFFQLQLFHSIFHWLTNADTIGDCILKLSHISTDLRCLSLYPLKTTGRFLPDCNKAKNFHMGSMWVDVWAIYQDIRWKIVISLQEVKSKRQLHGVKEEACTIGWWKASKTGDYGFQNSHGFLCLWAHHFSPQPFINDLGSLQPLPCLVAFLNIFGNKVTFL